MKRLIAVALVFFLVLVVGEMPSFGKSNVEFMNLYEQDSLLGAWGRLKFNLVGPTFEFLFNGHSLDPGTSYTLIRSREPEVILPLTFEVLASGTSNSEGDLHIAGLYNFGFDLVSDKILLIPTEDALGVSGKYLLGDSPISYDDTDTQLLSDSQLTRGCQAPHPSTFLSLGIPIGGKAIEFTLSSTEGQEFSLTRLLADKPVVLITGAYT